MSFDIPTDLITKSQIEFRNSVGLSSFDPNATYPPSVSTVEGSVSSVDSSPSNLRCKFCQSKLLRGLQSLICIHCGEYQTKDRNPEPISFSSTIGYTWLLQSLHFNGSERIGSLAEGSGVDGGHSPAEDELTLSQLLDLKITWREPEKRDNSINIKTSEHNSSLNTGTTDFDNFFAKSKSASVPDVHGEQSVASKADQNKIVVGQENVETDWNAEFQSADTKIESEKPESVDLFAGAEADLSSFGQTESFGFNKPDNFSEPFQDDLFANMSSTTFQQNDQLESVLQAKDGLFGDVNDSSLKSFGKKPDNDSDLFQDDLFANMGSTTFQQNDRLDPVLQAKDDLSGDVNDSILEEADEDWFSDGNWQKSSVKNTLNDVSLQDNPNDSSTDWFESANWQTSTSNPTTVKDDNLFDFKLHANDIISSNISDINNSDKQNSDVTDWFQNSEWAIGGSSSTTNIVVNKVNDDDDGFGEWNSFTSSTGNQNLVQDSWKESGNENVDYSTSEKMSDLDLFQSTVVSQDVDFGNFLQSDIFSGDKNPTDAQTVYDIFSEVPAGNRNPNTEAGNNAEGSKNNLNATTNLKDDVQMLMSQMHDLSFMLKNELSVPSKPDDIGTFHS